MPPPAPGRWAPRCGACSCESATAAQIARWPGMDPERTSRLLNGLYLQGGLMVLGQRTARPDTGRGSLLDRWRSGL